MNLLPWLPDDPERTEVVHELTQAAFAPYASLPRPSGALAETKADVAADLAAGGGLIAYDDTWTTPLGALRWRVEDDHLWVKRIAVDPVHQRAGVGNLLLAATSGVCEGVGRDRIRLGVRHALPANRAWFERRGFRAVVDHDDWTELERTITPVAFGRRVTLWKYEYPDHLQARFDVDVLEERPGGVWVRIPRYLPMVLDGRVRWVPPEDIVGWLPHGQWWTAWFSRGHQRVKVDVCTPFSRRGDGDLEFRDLSLDVVVRGDEPAEVVDEDEFDAAPYPDDVRTRARAAADDVLRRIVVGDEPFATEGFSRL